MTEQQQQSPVFTEARIPVTEDMVKAMLVGAFEGGSTWVKFHDYVLPEDGSIKLADFLDRRGKGGPIGRFCNPDPLNYYHPIQLVPLQPGCALQLYDVEGDGSVQQWSPSRPDRRVDKFDRYLLDRDKLIAGIQAMANLKSGEGGHHFGDWLNGNDDATTADVFLQCCLFGKIVYG